MEDIFPHCSISFSILQDEPDWGSRHFQRSAVWEAMFPFPIPALNKKPPDLPAASYSEAVLFLSRMPCTLLF